MANTDLSTACRPTIGGYSLHGVTGGLAVAAPSQITSPPLADVQAIYLQIAAAQGYWALDSDQVTTTNGKREIVPANTLVEVWRNSAVAPTNGTLTFYVVSQAGNPESTIRIEWV